MCSAYYFGKCSLIGNCGSIEMKLTNNFKVKPKNFQRKPPLSFSKTGNKDLQLVLHHCCKASCKVMLRVLAPTFKPVNNLICYKTGLMWVFKRATSLFNSFWSNVAGQGACFWLPFFPYLKITNVVTETAFSQIGRWNYAVQSVVVDVFSRLNFNGIFLFVPLKKLTCILSSVLRGIIKLPNFKPRRAGYESVYYGINNTRATRS